MYDDSTQISGGLIAYGAYKLSKHDAQRVEEYSGKPAEEMTDEELEQAMDQLSIEKQELTDEDRTYLDEHEAQEEGQGDYIDELERLGKLRDEGIITAQDFEDKKRQLLDL